MSGNLIRKLWISIVVCALISGSGATAGASRAGDMLRLLGFETAIEKFSQEAKNFQPVTGSEFSEFKAARDALADAVFDTELLMGAVETQVDGQFSDAEYDALEAYFSEGVGKRVTEAEKYAQSPENAAERLAETPGIIEDLVAGNPERLDQIELLLTVIDVAGSGTAMAMNLGYAMISGMASTGKLPGGTTDGQILHMLNASRDKIEAEVVKSAVLDAAFTYRDISNAEMRAYLGFLKSDLGRKLYRVLQNAQVDVLSEATRRYGKEVMALSDLTEL